MPKHKPIVIALTGKPGVGKDTLADMLCPALGFRRIAFADALRQEVSEAWNIPTRLLADRDTKEWAIPVFAVGQCRDLAFMRRAYQCHGHDITTPRSARWVMQQWGDYKRSYNPAYYADTVARWIHQQIGTGWSRFVVTDLRYPVEAHALEPFQASILRITRPQATPMAADTAGHSSENHGLIAAQHIIANDRGLTELAWAMLGVLDQLGVDVMANPADLWPCLASEPVPATEGGAA